ncbi:hypothetical protein ABEX78_32330 [Priestia megaterium]
MKTNSDGTVEEQIPSHIKKIQDKALGKSANLEIDWEYWFFVSTFVFRFSTKEFWEELTLRQLFVLCEQHEKFHKND